MSQTVSDLGLMALAFAGATAIAAAFGAANFGTALTFGVLAYVATLMWVLLRSD